MENKNFFINLFNYFFYSLIYFIISQLSSNLLLVNCPIIYY